MFSGLIEETGIVDRVERGAASARIVVGARLVPQGTMLGDSITVNGACLTVVAAGPATLAFEIVAETLDRTALSRLAPGDAVNLERSLPVSGRFGGHIVQGHVDGIGTIVEIVQVDTSYNVRVAALPGILRYIVEKGSIAIDGISLTVAGVDETGFFVSIIPHTWAHTNLAGRKAGDVVNLETDIIAKYVEKLLGGHR